MRTESHFANPRNLAATIQLLDGWQWVYTQTDRLYVAAILEHTATGARVTISRPDSYTMRNCGERWKVLPEWPEYTHAKGQRCYPDPYSSTPPEITVDSARTPAALAEDISRRLLCKMPALHINCIRRINKAAADHARDTAERALIWQLMERFGDAREGYQDNAICAGNVTISERYSGRYAITVEIPRSSASNWLNMIFYSQTQLNQ